MNVNAKVASSLNQLINEIRVKKRKRARATVEDCDLADPASAATCANSNAIYPPPIKRIRRGSSFNSRN